jgi:hypothetical protein
MDMDEKPTDKKQDDNRYHQEYTQEDYERDMVDLDVVSAYQKKLTEQLGHPVTMAEAQNVVHGETGTAESRTEELRQKYATDRPPNRSKPMRKPDSEKTS